jgi:hypothetical protein
MFLHYCPSIIKIRYQKLNQYKNKDKNHPKKNFQAVEQMETTQPTAAKSHSFIIKHTIKWKRTKSK